MISSAITVCLVPQARQGPFVYHEPLAQAIPRIAALGFDGVEVFAPDAYAIDATELRILLSEHGLRLAALGTGAGMLVHKLTLTDPDAAIRARAADFIRRIIDRAGELGAPAIIGSMQGRHTGDRQAALAVLADALGPLGEHARSYGVPLLYEPLNRYETNLLVRQGDAARWIRQQNLPNLKVLADLFHMNIEEADLPAALREVGDLLGHVHFVDSNRMAGGMGHMNFRPVIEALAGVGYAGYCSAECFPLPDTDSAARQVIQTHQLLFKSGQSLMNG